MKFPLLLAGVIVFGSTGFALRAPAQDAPPAPILPGRPDANVPNASAPNRNGPRVTAADDSNVELAPLMELKSAGIALQPPAQSKELRRALGSSEIVQFLNDDKHWKLTVSRTILSRPLPLVVPAEHAGPNDRPDPAQPRAGMLALTVGNLKGSSADAEILRQDVVNLADVPVGVIVARYATGTESLLKQEALIQASDQLYFTLEMTSPAPLAPADVTQDAGVRAAVATFNKVLDSVKLLDQTQLLEDQNQRLYRTRAFYVNLTETRLRNTIVPEQWWRLIKDGKDVGYSYVVEEIAQDLPKRGAWNKEQQLKAGGQDGVLVGVRSRTLVEANVQVDTESWMWVSLDRKHEIWSSIAHRLDKKANVTERYGEFGSSDSQVRTVVDQNLEPGERLKAGAIDQKQPPARQQETLRLRVTQVAGRGNNVPVERELPPFYLPQALAHLLPRILPRWELKGYMFASYVTDQHEVAKRYVDVGEEQEVTLGGQKLRAIPVRDRIGLEGSVTTHYVSPEGAFLGSVNDDSKLTILPSDAATLSKIWTNPDLTRPGEVEQPK